MTCRFVVPMRPVGRPLARSAQKCMTVFNEACIFPSHLIRHINPTTGAPWPTFGTKPFVFVQTAETGFLDNFSPNDVVVAIVYHDDLSTVSIPIGWKAVTSATIPPLTIAWLLGSQASELDVFDNVGTLAGATIQHLEFKPLQTIISVREPVVERLTSGKITVDAFGSPAVSFNIHLAQKTNANDLVLCMLAYKRSAILGNAISDISLNGSDSVGLGTTWIWGQRIGFVLVPSGEQSVSSVDWMFSGNDFPPILDYFQSFCVVLSGG